MVNVLVPLGFRSWRADEPNGFDDREGCAELKSEKTGPNAWNDVFCNRKKSWICEKAAGMEPLGGDLFPDGSYTLCRVLIC